MDPLEGKLDEKAEDQEPSNIPEFQEPTFQFKAIPAEVIGQQRENMWVEVRFRNWFHQDFKKMDDRYQGRLEKHMILFAILFKTKAYIIFL